MNHLRLASSALAAALLSLSSAHAGVMFSFGWSDFADGTPLTPNLDIGATGSLEARMALDANASTLTNGGSLDNTWGPNASNPPGTDNGRVSITARDNSVYIFLKNLTGVGVAIDFSNIYWDASKGNTGGLNPELAVVPDGTTTAFLPSFPITTYTDFTQPVGSPQSFFLNPGEEKLLLTFTRVGARRIDLDNIRVDGEAGFSAIPEVSSALVFGGLLGSGFLIRRRPRKAATA